MVTPAPTFVGHGAPRVAHFGYAPPCLKQPSTGPVYLGETGPLSQGVQARRKVLRIRHINGMEVRKKRSGGFKKRPRGFK